MLGNQVMTTLHDLVESQGQLSNLEYYARLLSTRLSSPAVFIKDPQIAAKVERIRKSGMVANLDSICQFLFSVADNRNDTFKFGFGLGTTKSRKNADRDVKAAVKDDPLNISAVKVTKPFPGSKEPWKSPLYKYYNSDTTEVEIVHDLIFVFQGIDGKYIKFTSTGFNLEFKGPKPVKQLVERLLQLGWMYKTLLDFKRGKGLVSQSLSACIDQELEEHYKLLARFQVTLDKNEQEDPKNFVSSSLTLKKLLVWTEVPFFRLKLLNEIQQQTKGTLSKLSKMHLVAIFYP
jgi:hypothetical protein